MLRARNFSHFLGFNPLSEFEDVYERIDCCLQN